MLIISYHQYIGISSYKDKTEGQENETDDDLTEGECRPTHSEALNVLNLVFQSSETQ